MDVSCKFGEFWSPANCLRDTRAKVPLVDTALGEIRAANAAGGNYAGILVVYNLPDRDCAVSLRKFEVLFFLDG